MMSFIALARSFFGTACIENSARCDVIRGPLRARSGLSATAPRRVACNRNAPRRSKSPDDRPGRHPPPRRLPALRAPRPTRCSCSAAPRSSGSRRSSRSSSASRRCRSRARPSPSCSSGPASGRPRRGEPRLLYLLLGLAGVPLYADHRHGWSRLQRRDRRLHRRLRRSPPRSPAGSPSAAGTSGSPRRSRRC